MTTTNTRTSSEQPDRRVTIRLRHHCDADLIQVLEQVSNVSEFIREVLRRGRARGEVQPPTESVIKYHRVS